MDGSYNFDPMTGKPIAQAPQIVPLKAKPEKPKKEFSKKEKVLAFVAAFIGYLFCRTFFVWQKPVVGLVFTLCLFTFALVFFGKQKRKIRSWFYLASALILSCGLFFSASPVLLLFVFAYICIAFLLFCQTGSGAALEGHAGQLYVFETIKAIFVSPFKSIGSSIDAIRSNKDGKKIGKTLLIVLAGIGIAIVPTIIVMQLLSFDSNFTDILDKIRLAIFDKLFEHIWSFVYGVPIGMYIYASLYASSHPEHDSYDAEKCIQIENKLKFAPTLAGAVAIIPLLFLYCVFIIAQGDYYKAIFTSTLPDAYTFAEFARNGFFRLCAVAAINALALIALRVFSKKTKSEKISPVVKIYTVILSVVTIVISATAISQMIMYVSTYGLTRLRLYTLWFMALLILLFLVTILKQFIEKLPFAATVLTLFVLCFGLLAVPDTDAIIARHNYNCHLAGTTYKLDVEYLGELSPSSIPVLCEIVENKELSEEIHTKALSEIGRYAAQENKTHNLPGILADKAYKSLGRKTQLLAAVAYDGLCPQVYLSNVRQSFSINNKSCDLNVVPYSNNDKTVFTDNSNYAPLKSGEQTATAVEMLEKYADMCQAAGQDNLMPFTKKDLLNAGRFYIALSNAGITEDAESVSSLYLYDCNKGCLVILHIV